MLDAAKVKNVAQKDGFVKAGVGQVRLNGAERGAIVQECCRTGW